MTVGELREALKDPMLEDRHEVLVGFLEATPDRLNADDAEASATGAAVRMVGLRRALVIGTDFTAWLEEGKGGEDDDDDDGV